MAKTPAQGSLQLVVRTDEGDLDTRGFISKSQLRFLRQRFPPAEHHVFLNRSILDRLRSEGAKPELLEQLDLALDGADGAKIGWRKQVTPGGSRKPPTPRGTVPRPPADARKAGPTKIALQAWWWMLMLGVILPSIFVGWVAACAWVQRKGIMSTKIPSYAALLGTGLVAIRWLAFAWMVVRHRGIVLDDDSAILPAVTVFSIRTRRIAYRDMAGAAERRRPGHSSEVVVVMNDRSEYLFPRVFEQSLAQIEKELSRRISRR